MLKVGVDTFASVEDADAYFSKKIEGEAWALITPDGKEKALASAYYDIVSVQRVSFDHAAAPDSVKQAQFEHALYLHGNSQSAVSTGGAAFKKINAETGMLEYDTSVDATPSRFIPIVDSLLGKSGFFSTAASGGFHIGKIELG